MEIKTRHIGNIITVCALIAVFVVPVISARLIYDDLRQQEDIKTTNHGRLIIPPAKLDALGVKLAPEDNGRWLLVHLASQGCHEDCEAEFYLMGQIIKGLGKESFRVHRLLILDALSPKPFSVPEHQLLHTEADLLLDFITHIAGEVDNLTVIVDPNGHVLMYYPNGTLTKAVIRDLRRLLEVSRIG